ncbi:Xaa-Pro aminopeptidase [Neorhodopirellula lusitana]|uniref:Xaa-Pro aminopeptidase n=1 Tax=Neorhodopirellula lusitana TaxID=445327 RepID=A0ABY1PY25_9BACT|nr:Xaa-Pro peptidase family protein [Neorhodopirellula lusitana]SMP52750.1 Xaa-Pro aminopeptidase [Neorhodopirellula lusitana]
MNPRIQKLACSSIPGDVDAILVVDETNVRYLTGFTGDSSWLVVRPDGQAVLLSDGRYDAQLANECPGLPTVIRPPGQGINELFTQFIRDEKLGKVAFQADHVLVASMKSWTTDLPDVTWVETSGLVEELRQIKDADELAIIRRAVDISQKAFLKITSELTADQTEAEIYYRLEAEMRSLGAEGVAFHPIVGVEPNGALPHYRPADVKLGDCQSLLIDWGSKVDGYCSDLTRTIQRPGRNSPAATRFSDAYQHVLDAQLAAIAKIGDGVQCIEVDRAARGSLEDAGLGDAFKHGLGHSFGLQIHEDPRMGPSSTGHLKAGMVVTVEPGVYFDGDFGIRIEDDILVTENGCEVLSDLAKGLDDCRILL